MFAQCINRNCSSSNITNRHVCNGHLLFFFTDKDGKISWEEFKKGHFSDDGKDDDSKEQMKEDEEKFKFADEDGDDKLDLEEYMAFYHPGVRNAWPLVAHAQIDYSIIQRAISNLSLNDNFVHRLERKGITISPCYQSLR